MAEWISRWKPFWIPIGDTFQKAYLDEWQLVDDESKRDPVEDSAQTIPCASDSSTVPSSMSNLWTPHRHRNPLGGEPHASIWKLSGTEGTSAFWGKTEALLPPLKRVYSFIHPKQLSPFPERLELPYPNGEILSNNEEDVSFIRDGFTTWVKEDFNTILERHAVDVRKAFAEYREASVRRQEAPAQ